MCDIDIYLWMCYVKKNVSMQYVNYISLLYFKFSIMNGDKGDFPS